MEQHITWAYRPQVVFESVETVPANTSAHLYPSDAVGFAVIDGAQSVADRQRRVFKLSGPGVRVWSSSVKPNQPSTRVSAWSRFLNFFWSNQR